MPDSVIVLRRGFCSRELMLFRAGEVQPGVLREGLARLGSGGVGARKHITSPAHCSSRAGHALPTPSPFPDFPAPFKNAHATSLVCETRIDEWLHSFVVL